MNKTRAESSAKQSHAIHKELTQDEAQAFERLKAELVAVFAAPESSYRRLTAAEVIARNSAAGG